MRSVVARLDDLVMLRGRVETRKHGARLRRHDTIFVIRSCERDYGVERIEQHHGDEFDFVAGVTPQKVDGAEARDLAREDARKDFRPQQTLVSIRVRGRGPHRPRQ